MMLIQACLVILLVVLYSRYKKAKSFPNNSLHASKDNCSKRTKREERNRQKNRTLMLKNNELKSNKSNNRKDVRKSGVN